MEAFTQTSKGSSGDEEALREKHRESLPAERRTAPLPRPRDSDGRAFEGKQRPQRRRRWPEAEKKPREERAAAREVVPMAGTADIFAAGGESSPQLLRPRR